MAVVVTFGVWDLLHVGHVRFLERARKHGPFLVVGVPTDEVVIEDKGRPPVVPFAERKAMLESCRWVDVAIRYDVLDFAAVLDRVRPHVLAVGDQWGAERRHRDAEAWIAGRGGRKVVIPRTPGVSTTELVHRIREGVSCSRRSTS